MNKRQEQKEDDVLRRMLNTPPTPHVAKAKPKKRAKKVKAGAPERT